MPSKVDIANWALDRLGQKNIISFDDGNTTANYIKRLYPLCRDEIFRKFPWKCLTGRYELAADATAPTFGYTYRYLIPSDVLFIREVIKGTVTLHEDWEREGDYILTDQAGPLRIIFTKQEEDPNKWDALLVSTVAAYLALELAEPLTQSQQKVGRAQERYNAILREARFVNAQEGNARKLATDTWVSVRHGGTGRGG